MKVTIEFEISDREAKILSENSIERVINMSIELASRSEHPDSYTNEEDWKELKPLVRMLWCKTQDAIFVIKNPWPKQ